MPDNRQRTRPSAVGRRALLLAGAGFGAAAGVQALGMPFIARAEAAEPIRIGMLWAKTGNIADQAEYLAQGSLLALEQQNNAILGRPAEIIWLDEPNPQGAQQNAQRLVDEHKVVALVGGALSSFALAESAVARRARVPFIAANAAAADLTGKACNRYTFRLQPPVDVHTQVMAPYAAERGKKWYLLTASYAFGQGIRDSFLAYAKANGITIVGQDEAPLNTADYSSFILKIRAAKPDVVIGGLSGGDLTTFLKQWNELGMRGRVPFVEISIGDTDIWGVGPEAADGVFTKTWYYNNPDNTADDKAFAAAYLAKHKRPAADKAWMGWYGMRSLLQAIEMAKSTEVEAIVGGLTQWQAREGDLDVHYRAFDHQMIRRTLVCQVKNQITDKWDYFDVKAALPRAPADVEAVFGAPETTGCHMDAA
jgi:branched-chain amino acid transport system substrate-binding protein